MISVRGYNRGGFDVREELKELFELCVERGDITPFTEAAFDIELFPSQKRIVNNVFFERDSVVNCYTRYGKTFAVGAGLASKIWAQVNVLHEGFKIGCYGPSGDDAALVKRELLKVGGRFKGFRDLVDTSRGNDYDDLLKSRRKERLTFGDGLVDFVMGSAASGVMTGKAGGGRGSGAMGEGFDVVVLDESCRISFSAWQNYLHRLLEKESSYLIELGNPWHKDNHFFRHWNSGRFDSVHVGMAEGVEEGRHSRNWFEEKAEEVGGKDTNKWKVLYLSEFPDRKEQGLIGYSEIERAKGLKFFDGRADSINEELGWEVEADKVQYGFDVAGKGKDKAVLTRFEKYGAFWYLTDVWSRDYVDNPMVLVGWARERFRDDKEGFIVNVDAIGIGDGVYGRFKELGFRCNGVNVGEGSERKSNKFRNKKAEFFWNVRSIFSEGRIIFEAENVQDLVTQLAGMEYEFDSSKRIMIVDPESGSPDFADSLMLGVTEVDDRTRMNSLENPFAV